jgi:hypothetical protein
VSVLETAPGMLAVAFRQLRACGGGRRECVLYWTGRIDTPGLVDRIEHPRHHSRAGGYEVDSAWVTALFRRLRDDRRCVRMQIHTHPGPAGHSDTDDRFALVPASGFLSLVIPDFAGGFVSLDRAHLVQMDDKGEWRRVAVSEVIAP